MHNSKDIQGNVNNNQDDFYKAADSWFYDRYHSQSVWLKRCILALGVVTLLLFLSLLMNVLLLPLKQKVPYLYAFDKATGEVSKLGVLEATKLTGNWQMTRFFLTRYIINRESYDSYNVTYPYQQAWAMSNHEIRQAYVQESSSKNPKSPYHHYGKSKYITVTVIGISRLNKNTASVRFDKVLHDRATGGTSVAHKEAIVKWTYTQPETTQRMLDRDPLGFKVTYYNVSQMNVNS